MRLVVVAAVLSDLGEAGSVVTAQAVGGALESEDPRERLRREAELVREAAAESPAAVAQLTGQFGDLHVAAGLAEPPPGRGNRHRWMRRFRQAPRQLMFHEVEALVPARLLVKALEELLRSAAQHVFERHHPVGELAEWHAENGPRRRRAQIDLHPVLHALVLREGGPVAQACGEGAMDLIAPGSIHEPQLIVEAEDQHDATERRL